MTRYYMPVALSEQFHAVVIMPSKDITMQDIRISKFQSDLFFARLPSAQFQRPVTGLALGGVPEELDDHEHDLHDHHCARHSFTEQSGGISCKAVSTAGCVSCDVRADQFPHQAGNLGGCELVGGHKGPEGGGQRSSVQVFRPNHPCCQASQARMPHTVCNLMEGLFVQ